MSTLVKSPWVLVIAVAALVAFGPTPDFASQPPAAHDVQNSEVVGRARSAFLRFAAACITHDRSRIAQAVTDDVVVEYDLPDPGITLTVDSAALDSLCAASASGDTAGQISNLLIFPMTDPNTVFIQYQAPSRPDASSRAKAEVHMAIVELRGDRIAKLRDFVTTTDGIASVATGSAHNAIP